MNRSILALLALACLPAAHIANAGEESIKLVDGTGRDSTSSHCAICHSLDYIQMNAPLMDRAAWEKTVQKMITRFGAPIDEGAARNILDYLSAHYVDPAGPRP
jgi:sulfite dehydrogenase (cytochrome) subunit B